jgi:hypothetical protein
VPKARLGHDKELLLFALMLACAGGLRFADPPYDFDNIVISPIIIVRMFIRLPASVHRMDYFLFWSILIFLILNQVNSESGRTR